MNQRQRSVLAAAGLLLITAAAYAGVAQCGFIWDDDLRVSENPTLRSLAGLHLIWFEIAANKQNYPLVFTSFWIEYRLWGADPLGYHLVNLLLHASSAVLLWRVLLALGASGAWLVAAVFALHPVHVESVACTLPAALLVALWWKHGFVSRRDVFALVPFFAVGIGLGSSPSGSSGPWWAPREPSGISPGRIAA